MYEVIPKTMVKEGGNYVNNTVLPSTEEHGGRYIGVGYPNVHNLYKGHWDARTGRLTWNFVRLVTKW